MSRLVDTGIVEFQKNAVNNEFDIAIIGMAGRFPGARNLDEFWQNLAGGVESIARLSDKEILESGVPASHLTQLTIG